MTISDLQKILAKAKRKHGDVEIAYNRYSDIALMANDETGIVEGVANLHGHEGWVTEAHPTMTEEQLARKKTYFIFPGN